MVVRMSEDTGMNEARKEVRLWRKNRLKKKKICNTGHDGWMDAYVNSKEEATVLYREVRD